MKEFLYKYGGWICTGILIAVLLFITFGKKTDYSEAQNKIDTAQVVRDSLRPVIDSLTRELEATKVEVNAEKDSIYSLLVEANNKLIYVYQKQRAVIRVDNIGSDSLRKLYGEITRLYEDFRQRP